MHRAAGGQLRRAPFRRLYSALHRRFLCASLTCTLSNLLTFSCVELQAYSVSRALVRFCIILVLSAVLSYFSFFRGAAKGDYLGG